MLDLQTNFFCLYKRHRDFHEVVYIIPSCEKLEMKLILISTESYDSVKSTKSLLTPVTPC